MSLGEWGWGPLKMALNSKTIGWGDGLFHRIPFSVLGGVSLFRVSGVDERDVKYSSLCLANPNAMRTATLPDQLISRLSTVPIEPTPHIVQPGTVTDKTADILMHMVLTAVEYLAKAAMHHMTAKAAYYLWENERHREHGYDLIDWLRAKDEVRTRIRAEASRTA